MAIMIPSVISPDVKSNAEKHIFKWFQKAPGTEDWIILHSLGVSNHKKVIHGEVDFFALIPEMGIFALEVKGGRVRRQNGHLLTNMDIRIPKKEDLLIKHGKVFIVLKNLFQKCLIMNIGD